jgi:hypothetical protein
MFGWLGRPRSQACGVQKGQPRLHCRKRISILFPACAGCISSARPILQACLVRSAVRTAGNKILRLARVTAAQYSFAPSGLGLPLRLLSPSLFALANACHRRARISPPPLPRSTSSKGSPSATSSRPSVGLQGSVLHSSLFDLSFMFSPASIVCVLIL